MHQVHKSLHLEQKNQTQLPCKKTPDVCVFLSPAAAPAGCDDSESMPGPRKESAGSLEVTNLGHFGVRVPWVFCHTIFWGHPSPSWRVSNTVSPLPLVSLLTDCDVAGVALISAGPRGQRGAEECPQPGWRLIHNAQSIVTQIKPVVSHQFQEITTNSLHTVLAYSFIPRCLQMLEM